MNGYFQLITKGGRWYVRLFPETDGGAKIDVNELREYLAQNNILVDPVQLNSVISSLAKTTDYPIEEELKYAVNETFSLKISDDRMTAVARFYPESTGGQKMLAGEIINDLMHKNVKLGVNQDGIQKFIENREYCTDIVVAMGKDPVQGTDARIDYYFKTDLNTKPKLLEDGSVDFFNIETVCMCKKDELLAHLTKEVKGERGYRVTGESIAPRDVRALKLKYANNIYLSEDGTDMFAKCDGHVSLVDDKVFVSNVLEVVDVGPATGNINFVGNVLVKGNVLSGYTIEAEGDVDIKGAVEGAYIKATGNVIIVKGINGMGKCQIEAGGNVVAKFIENGNVNAGGFVSAEAIMLSNVSSKKEITVTGKRGFIVGGSVRSIGNVEAKTIGSETGSDTKIEVGADPALKKKISDLEKIIKDASANIEKIEPTLTSLIKTVKMGTKLTLQQNTLFMKLQEQYKMNKTTLENATEEYDKLSDFVDNSQVDSCVIVHNTLYPGTTLTINGVTQRMTKPCMHSRMVRDGADIRVKAI